LFAGVKEARAAGKLMAEEGVEIDEVYTSLLRRSTKTVWLAMQEMQLEWAPVVKDWR
jgi:2,3-bisphosphoglycerate-dependent phosphoglycerate mutase